METFNEIDKTQWSSIGLLIESNNSNLNRGEFDSIRMGYIGLVRLSVRMIRLGALVISSIAS